MVTESLKAFIDTTEFAFGANFSSHIGTAPILFVSTAERIAALELLRVTFYPTYLQMNSVMCTLCQS